MSGKWATTQRGRRGGALLVVAGIGALALSVTKANAQAPNLGRAASFAVLASSTVTNAGTKTVVNGDLGVSPGTAVTGFPPGKINGITSNAPHTGPTSLAAGAQTDARAAYVVLASEGCTQTLTGNLGDRTLTPGVYCFAVDAQLTGTLTLDFQGNPDNVFIFRVGAALTTASGSVVSLTNAGNPCNVFWQVGSSATLGTSSVFVGTLLADQSITATTGARIQGRLLALEAAVTLDDNVVTVPTCDTTTTTAGGAATTSTAGAGGGATTSTAGEAGTPTSTTTATGSAARTTLASGVTTSTAVARLAPTTTLGSGAATSTTLASGATTTTKAAPGVTGRAGGAGLGGAKLPHTGQGLNGPVSLAVLSIFLGGLLLLAPGRQRFAGADSSSTAGSTSTVPERFRTERVNSALDYLERHARRADARIDEVDLEMQTSVDRLTGAVESFHRGVRTATGTDEPIATAEGADRTTGSSD